MGKIVQKINLNNFASCFTMDWFLSISTEMETVYNGLVIKAIVPKYFSLKIPEVLIYLFVDFSKVLIILILSDFFPYPSTFSFSFSINN
jgi:hypothetical protein